MVAQLSDKTRRYRCNWASDAACACMYCRRARQVRCPGYQGIPENVAPAHSRPALRECSTGRMRAVLRRSNWHYAAWDPSRCCKRLQERMLDTAKLLEHYCTYSSCAYRQTARLDMRFMVHTETAGKSTLLTGYNGLYMVVTSASDSSLYVAQTKAIRTLSAAIWKMSQKNLQKNAGRD